MSQQEQQQQQQQQQRNGTTKMEMRRSASMPVQEHPEILPSKSDLRYSKSEDLSLSNNNNIPKHDVIRYGKILEQNNNNSTTIPTSNNYDAKTLKRIQKWNAMLNNWNKTRPRLIKKRLRKGLPGNDALRKTVWTKMTRARERQLQNPGMYRKLVEESLSHERKTRDFRTIQDTIERDIHRTFPRHALFLETNSHNSLDTTNLSKQIVLQFQEQPDRKSILENTAGQFQLRRILKAYSMYDTEIGYCQGMNFIAGLFLTVLLDEESAFWMLTYVMDDRSPCHMRNLFGEGMKQTHQVLFVADKLVQQFLPKLAKHFYREMVHVTMYATQWLLTQYTSSFRFELVIKLWDCFLFEGWKITYRVMLAILQTNQSRLLKMHFEEILAFFRDLPEHCDGSLIGVAVKIPLRTSHIRRYEKEWELQQEQNTNQNGDSHRST